MVIKSIEEINNEDLPNMKPVREVMDINVPLIEIANISKRNGMVYLFTGAGGSGKTSLLLNMFNSTDIYKKKYHHIYYLIPESSFLSVSKHPFKEHDKIYHELSANLLYNIYDELMQRKEERITKKLKPQYNMVIIDDFADCFKSKEITTALNKLIIKARHLNTGFIFTLQSFFYMPRIIRKQLTYITIFKPRSLVEFETLANELCNMGRDDAIKVFNYVFDAPYNHLDIDLVNNNYFKNFNLLSFNE